MAVIEQGGTDPGSKIDYNRFGGDVAIEDVLTVLGVGFKTSQETAVCQSTFKCLTNSLQPSRQKAGREVKWAPAGGVLTKNAKSKCAHTNRLA